MTRAGRHRANRGPTKVAILGGGIGGMSAAHELAERGFRVTVYEARDGGGGKARSSFVPGTGRDGRRGLPGEHGFRFFPSFYRHLPDTMRRIPFAGNPGGVESNLVSTDRTRLLRVLGAPLDLITHFPTTLSELREFLPTAWFERMGIPWRDLQLFLERVWVFLTSCDARRYNDYEDLTYWDFFDADRRHPNFQLFLGEVAVQALVALQPRRASARTTATIGLQLWMDHFRPGRRVARLLNGPTHDVWLGPWYEHLQRLGVRHRFGARVAALECVGGRIAGARLADGSRVEAEHYIAALPADRMAPLLDDAILAADPQLAGIGRLQTGWMSGIQFFLRRDVPITRGHVVLVDAPWGITCISQPQFWRARALAAYGDGSARGLLSLCIANWDRPGTFVQRPARECTRDEIRTEVWEQMKAHLRASGDPPVYDEDLIGWFLADSVEHRPDGTTTNHEPLLINTVGSWWDRPEATTRIQNLLLAADYVRTHTDIATMESANEAARRAVNAILEDVGSSAERCEIWPLEEPDVFKPQRKLDEIRFRRGLPHVFARMAPPKSRSAPTRLPDTVVAAPSESPDPGRGSGLHWPVHEGGRAALDPTGTDPS